jgi:hypothetical protein
MTARGVASEDNIFVGVHTFRYKQSSCSVQPGALVVASLTFVHLLVKGWG